jgi:hypothetical protein
MASYGRRYGFLSEKAPNFSFRTGRGTNAAPSSAYLVIGLHACEAPLHVMALDALDASSAETHRLLERISQLEAIARLNGEIIRGMQRATGEIEPPSRKPEFLPTSRRYSGTGYSLMNAAMSSPSLPVRPPGYESGWDRRSRSNFSASDSSVRVPARVCHQASGSKSEYRV